MAIVNCSKRKVLVVATAAHRALFPGIARYARDHDWHLVSDMMPTGAFPRGWAGDGILAVVGPQPDLLAQLQHSRLPRVLIAQAGEPVAVPCVAEDHVHVGRLAADHLLARAYRSFAWAPLVDDQPNRERLAGFRARLAEYDCRCHVLPEAHSRIGPCWECNWIDYRCRLVAQLDRLPRPTAIFAFNDSVAANLMDACRDCGISIPEGFAILGVDNDPLVGESVPIPLSSVELDHERMAAQAAELLDRLMRGDAVPAGVVSVAPKGVITRVSTDVTAVSDARIARALAYIAENYSNPMLSVLDVASAVGVSRRNLERGFRHTTNCTIREHIVRLRMQEASRLLTNHPRTRIVEIAGLAGFAGTGNFFRTFRQFYGVSPQAHRERTAHGTPAPLQIEALREAYGRPVPAAANA